MVALSCFFDNLDDIDSCILINSGFKLEDLNLESIKISGEDWGKFLSNLDKKINYDGENIKQDDFYNKYFNPIFLWRNEQQHEKLKSQLKKYSKRILYITSGADEVADPSIINKIMPSLSNF